MGVSLIGVHVMGGHMRPISIVADAGITIERARTCEMHYLKEPIELRSVYRLSYLGYIQHP